MDRRGFLLAGLALPAEAMTRYRLDLVPGIAPANDVGVGVNLRRSRAVAEVPVAGPVAMLGPMVLNFDQNYCIEYRMDATLEGSERLVITPIGAEGAEYSTYPSYYGKSTQQIYDCVTDKIYLAVPKTDVGNVLAVFDPRTKTIVKERPDDLSGGFSPWDVCGSLWWGTDFDTNDLIALSTDTLDEVFRMTPSQYAFGGSPFWFSQYGPAFDGGILLQDFGDHPVYVDGGMHKITPTGPTTFQDDFIIAGHSVNFGSNDGANQRPYSKTSNRLYIYGKADLVEAGDRRGIGAIVDLTTLTATVVPIPDEYPNTDFYPGIHFQHAPHWERGSDTIIMPCTVFSDSPRAGFAGPSGSPAYSFSGAVIIDVPTATVRSLRGGSANGTSTENADFTDNVGRPLGDGTGYLQNFNSYAGDQGIYELATVAPDRGSVVTPTRITTEPDPANIEPLLSIDPYYSWNWFGAIEVQARIIDAVTEMSKTEPMVARQLHIGVQVAPNISRRP